MIVALPGLSLTFFCQFGGHAVSSCQRPWNMPQRERPRQFKINIMFNRKKDKLTKDVPSSSDLADFVL